MMLGVKVMKKNKEEGKDNSDNGEVSEEEWKQRMLNAAKVAATKSCGKNSAFLNKLLSQLKPPQKRLENFITRVYNTRDK